MKFTSKRKRQLIDAIKRTKKLIFGSSCIFFPLDEKVGVKFYQFKSHRDKSLMRQHKAANFGLAPLCGGSFDFECFFIQHNQFLTPKSQYSVIYGYMTEIASIPPKSQRSALKKSIFNLECNLENIGIVHHDLHLDNIGVLRNKVVCIDFDVLSCELKRGRTKKLVVN